MPPIGAVLRHGKVERFLVRVRPGFELPTFFGIEGVAYAIPPKLAVADGALGFWPALERVWPSRQKQRCWVHKTVNVWDKLPKKLQPEAKERRHAIWQAETKRRPTKRSTPSSKCTESSTTRPAPA